MTIFILISLDGSGDIECFSTRPRTLECPENFPTHYDLRIADVDGGDSRVIMRRRGHDIEVLD